MLDDEHPAGAKHMFTPINSSKYQKGHSDPKQEATAPKKLPSKSPSPENASKKKKTREPRFTITYLSSPVNEFLYDRMNSFNPLAASVLPDIVEEVDRKYGPNGTEEAKLKLRTASTVSAVACTNLWKQSRIAFALDRGEDPPWQWVQEWVGYLKERQDEGNEDEDVEMGGEDQE